MCPTPVPPSPTQRPTPPAPTGRPTPPAPTGRPTPPAPTAPTLTGDVMEFLARKADRDGNGVIEDHEARVVGKVGNRNGVNGTAETARALNAGEAMIYGFQLAKDWAEAIAQKLAGDDPWVSREDFDISDAARERLDANDDRRISANELAAGLQRGGLGMNGKAIVTSDEARERFSRPTPPAPGGDRPTPPSPTGDRPTPPRPGTDRPTPPSPGGDRPTPPRPGVDRPTPPRPDNDRPVPPPAYTRTPDEVTSRFTRQYAELKQVYNSTSMSQAEYQAAQARIIDQAVRELVEETRHAPFLARKTALATIYNTSSMTSERQKAVEAELLRVAIDDLLDRPFPNFRAAKAELDALYNGSSMTTDMRNQAERRLLAKEVDRIVYGTFPSYLARRQALDALYNGSSMTTTERDDAARRIEAEAARRGGSY